MEARGVDEMIETCLASSIPVPPKKKKITKWSFAMLYSFALN
jgi:hypothetical protein